MNVQKQQSLDLSDGTTTTVLWNLVNVMNRADPGYCQSHCQEPCTDKEWDAALQAAEDELNRLGIPPHPEQPR